MTPRRLTSVLRVLLLLPSLTPGFAPAASPVTFAQTTLFREGEGPYNNYRIPAVVRTKNNTILAFCEGRQTPFGPGNDTGEINLVLRRSTDHGATFSPQQVVWADGKNTCGNPCPVVDKSTGTVWLLMTHNLGEDHEKDIIAGTSKDRRTVWVTHSTDDGATWAKPAEITSQVSKPAWAWYATGPGVGVQLQHGEHKGRLVIPCDYVERRAEGRAGAPGNSHVIYSDDHGQTWHLGGEPTVQRFNESQIVELDGGRLMLNMRNGGASKNKPEGKIRGTAVSTDGGATFGAPRWDEALTEPICQASIVRLTWPEQGKSRILFANPASATERKLMTVRLSYDEAQTWPVSKLIFKDWTGYSSIVPLGDGNIGLLYEAGDKRRYERIDFVRFSLDWLTDGKDSLAAKATAEASR